MNYLHGEIDVINGPQNVPAYGPTLPIAIAHAMPNLASELGNAEMVLGIRPRSDFEPTTEVFPLVIKPYKNFEEREDNRYQTKEVPIYDELVAFDVYRELDEIEGMLRDAANKRFGRPNEPSRLPDLGIDFMDAINDIVVYDPDARIPLILKLEEIFDGADWRIWVPTSVPSVVDIRNVEIVGHGIDEALFRFEYYFSKPGGLSVHERGLEYADLKDNCWVVRQDRYSALRGIDPPFKGLQLPQVYHSLQAALNKGCYVGNL